MPAQRAAKLLTRSTPDLVMLLLTVLILILVTGSMLGVAVVLIFDEDGSINISKLVASLASTTNSLIAAVVGYAAGRGMSYPRQQPLPPVEPEPEPE